MDENRFIELAKHAIEWGTESRTEGTGNSGIGRTGTISPPTSKALTMNCGLKWRTLDTPRSVKTDTALSFG